MLYRWCTDGVQMVSDILQVLLQLKARKLKSPMPAQTLVPLYHRNHSAVPETPHQSSCL